MVEKKERRCPNCGAEIDAADKFCSGCGKPTQLPKGLPKVIEWQIDNACYRIDKQGASYTAPAKNPLTTHSEEIGTIMTTIGLIKNSPSITTVGATTMSQKNRSEKGWIIRWKDIREVKCDPEKCMISLKEKLFTNGLGGGLGTFHVCCTPENYETVALACQTFQGKANKH